MRTRNRTILALTALTIAIGGIAVPGTAAPPESEQQVLHIDVSAPYKEVDQAASGSLYGLAAEGWPPDEWIEQVAPKMFTQPPPGATHLPNQEPAPIGDTLDVWPIAARHGATVTVRLADIFPTFPYQWLGDDYWYGQVETMVQATVDSGAPNIYGYEIWNEPQWTWNDSWGSFNEMWDRTYRLIRELDPDTPIIGPSIDRDFENGMRDFLTAAVASDTVPDIISWHELEPWTAFDVEEHVALYREMEQEFGIGPLPISINEYGSPRDSGVPGSLARLVARLERAEVDTANLAFWHKPGRLSDLLVPTGGGSGPTTDPLPTGNFWLFKWYGEMTGQMVETTPPSNVGRRLEVGEPVEVPATRVASRDGFGQAITLGGDEPNRYAELPEGILSDVEDLTIATWVNRTTTSGQTWSRIFDFGTGTGNFMFLTVDAGGQGLRFALNPGGSGEQQITASPQLPTGWQHVAVTLEGTTGTLYLNGEVVGTNPNMDASPADLGATTQNWIGRSQFGADPLLNATVDEFHIFDHALSPQDIAALMATPGGATGGGNVASYGFDEEGGATIVDASGNDNHATVITPIEGVEHLPVLDGFASVDPETRTARVIFGGANGDIRLQIDGLDDLGGFGGHANVQVFATERTGTDGVSDGPIGLFEGDYQVRGGSISVPVAGLAASDAYLAVITPRRDAPAYDHPVRRYEAEEAISPADSRWLSTARSPFASNGRYVEPKRAGGGHLTFDVDAAAAGAHDLAIRYANPTTETAAGALEVNGQAQDDVAYEPTTSTAPFRTEVRHVVLEEGSNTIVLGLDAGAVSVDHIEVTPFRERFEAESGEWSSASLTTIDFAETNFFAPYFSNNAYVRNLNSANSNLRLPVTVPAAGTYELTISYSTAGNEAVRRAQTVAQHALRVDDGDWQIVTYTPTQFRDLTGLTTVSVELPAGTSVITLAKDHPDHPGDTLPGTVDLDYVEVELQH